MSKKLAALACSVVILIAIGVGWMNRTANGEANMSSSASNEELRLDIRSSKPLATVMRENVFLLTLTDAQGLPLEHADINAYLVMPSMFCGKIPVEVTETSSGEYRLSGIPVMSGKWNAEIAVTAKSSTLHAAHVFTAK
ncbi:FixH family protein [Cohnella terricola]|nr:FixH family protein [Cohnella terricola]